LTTLEWNNSRLLRGELVDAVTDLKRQPGRDLLVGGSLSLARELARHRLVDLYRLTIYPVALGRGKRLFDGDRVDLELIGQRATSTGVVLASYKPGAPVHEATG
jgi:dihydrofolate reductase